MRDLGFWDPALQAGDFLLKRLLSFELDSFISGNACVHDRESAFIEKQAPIYTNNVVIKSSRPAVYKINAYKNILC